MPLICVLQEKLHEAIANLSSQKIERHTKLGPNIHAPLDAEVIIRMEKVAFENEKVQAELKKLQLPEGSVVVCDPWPYGMCKCSPWKVQRIIVHICVLKLNEEGEEASIFL